MKLGFDLAVYACLKSTSPILLQPHPCKFGPSFRNAFVLTYIISGKGYYEVNNETYELTAGDSFLVYPGIKVKYYPDENDKWEYIWVDFKGDKVDEMLAETAFTVDKPILYANENNIYEKFCELYDLCVINSRNQTAINALKYKACFYLFFCEYIKSYPTSNKKSINLKSRIINYINENFSKSTFSVTDIEEEFSMSETALYKYFKQNFHTTPKKQINELRIKKARTKLQDPSVSVKDAAFSVGFKDPLYFSKVFKNKYGINPSKYYEYYIKNENKFKKPQ